MTFFILISLFPLTIISIHMYIYIWWQGVLMPLLEMELKEEAQSLIQSGVPPQLISKVFENVRDKVHTNLYLLFLFLLLNIH